MGKLNLFFFKYYFIQARLELSLISDPKTHMHINNIFVNYEDILVWTNAVAQDLEEQLKMNAVILSNICHLKTRNLALFHQGRRIGNTLSCAILKGFVIFSNFFCHFLLVMTSYLLSACNLF